VYGNGDDLIDNPQLATFAIPSFCDIGDGDFVGVSGNIASDPLFRDVASSDYRLVWGSPCIDTSDPSTPLSVPDLQGLKRPVDGNLDTQEFADMGALEFAPLWAVGPVHPGETLVLESWGPAGGTGTLFVARGQPLVVPQSTPFGELDLDLDQARNLGTQAIAPGPPTLRMIQIPNAPVYAGLTLTFQELSTASVGAPSMAYTNAITLIVLP
jgi:hypothetical protein